MHDGRGRSNESSVSRFQVGDSWILPLSGICNSSSVDVFPFLRLLNVQLPHIEVFVWGDDLPNPSES